jgi:hypothetical protein
MASTLGAMASIRQERHPSDAKARNLDAVRELRRVGNIGSTGIGAVREHRNSWNVRGGNNSNVGWRQCGSGRATLATIWESRACEDWDQ